MKIVIHSPAFAPQIGGLEEIARLCASEFTRQGHAVTVICETPNEPLAEFPFAVLRKASWREKCRVTRECDVFLMFNMSLKGLPLPLLFGRPLVISHQGWYGAEPEDLNLRARFKRFLSRWLASNIACSQAVANYLGGDVTVIPNAYNDALFHLREDIPRSRDILFVGRLVSDKGANLLVEALISLAKEDVCPTVSITGVGPEEQSIKQQAAHGGLDHKIVFTGPLRGEELARHMNAHRILVVPSLWAEPFGIVAVEGIASGCLVIGSERGGLKEAIGMCGITFENGNLEALMKAMRQELRRCSLAEAAVPHQVTMLHLAKHHARSVGQQYLNVCFSRLGHSRARKSS